MFSVFCHLSRHLVKIKISLTLSNYRVKYSRVNNEGSVTNLLQTLFYGLLVELPGFARDNCGIFVPNSAFYFTFHIMVIPSFESLTSIKPQNAPWCPHCKTPEMPRQWKKNGLELGALDWRPGGPGFESCCGNFASELWQFRLPRFAGVFRRRH